MTYQQQQATNAARTSAQAVAVLRHGMGSSTASAAALAPTATPGLISVVIAAGAVRAVLLADLGLSAWLTKHVGQPVSAIGLTLPEDTRDQIDHAVDTIVSESGHPDDLQMRTERLARAVPLDAGQDAYQEAAATHGLTAWIRRPDPSPCPACKKLADGKARPMSVRMWRHPGCECVAEPVHPGEDWHGELISGSGIAGQITNFARPGITFTRSAFVAKQGGQR